MLVLFVDHDFEDYDLFCEALGISYPKVQCLHAKNGLEAFGILKDLVLLPSYIFLDINMPLIGGKEFLTKIKTTARLKEIRIIIYSTTVNETERAIFKKLGIYHFFVKPANYISLVIALRELIIP